MIRRIILHIHRVIGLGAAFFLTLLGITGAILVWEEELDAQLNSALLYNRVNGPAMAPPELIDAVTAEIGSATIDFLSYPRDPQRSAIFYVSGLVSPLGPVNQVFVDRGDGRILGNRNTVTPNLYSRAELLPWLYQFHYSLVAGRTGIVLLGVVACLWFFDCLIAWYLTLPRRWTWHGWKPAWLINKNRLNFDVHRAVGLWLSPVLAVIAFTSIYFNLYTEVFLPVVNAVSTVTTQPYEGVPRPGPGNESRIEYAEALNTSYAELEGRGLQVEALGYLSRNPQRGYYVAAFYTDRDLSRDAPSAHVYVNEDGSLRHVRIIGEGSAGDAIVDWQFPLHSGQAFGLFGRIVVFLSGILLAVLSATGVVIWWRKLRARKKWGQSKGPT